MDAQKNNIFLTEKDLLVNSQKLSDKEIDDIYYKMFNILSDKIYKLENEQRHLKSILSIHRESIKWISWFLPVFVILIIFIFYKIGVF